ncbi:DUF2897 family protein [Echinimonas agarilytica]|uniref:DUF2897 family protein n=1 Tax=Echinimonas agarilytica TaxID=1215918 RepID=A0AA41W5D8_9GAMM|nr:DUF2897 family protein [Echinimonas agarilytica]MCM2679287.1 DUF2897 family protein [Echinimonas agarilytica]
MELNHWAVIGIIALAIGVIVSNLMLLKYSAKMKLPSREDLVDPVAKAKKQRDAEKEQDEKV